MVISAVQPGLKTGIVVQHSRCLPEPTVGQITGKQEAIITSPGEKRDGAAKKRQYQTGNAVNVVGAVYPELAEGKDASPNECRGGSLPRACRREGCHPGLLSHIFPKKQTATSPPGLPRT